MKTLHLSTIDALMTLQGFVNNEIAKRDAAGDKYSALHWRQYLAKIVFLEDDIYSEYKQLKVEQQDERNNQRKA